MYRLGNAFRATSAAASHHGPGSLFRDARFFGEIRSLNAATPENVANTVHVRRSRGYEAQARAVTTNQWGLFRDAGSFDRPRPIERNDTTPKDVANAIRVRRSRGAETLAAASHDNPRSFFRDKFIIF